MQGKAQISAPIGANLELRGLDDSKQFTVALCLNDFPRRGKSPAIDRRAPRTAGRHCSLWIFDGAYRERIRQSLRAGARAFACNRKSCMPKARSHFHLGNGAGHGHLVSASDRSILPSKGALPAAGLDNNRPQPSGRSDLHRAARRSYCGNTRLPQPILGPRSVFQSPSGGRLRDPL
jgi:hypothetical protein